MVVLFMCWKCLFVMDFCVFFRVLEVVLRIILMVFGVGGMLFIDLFFGCFFLFFNGCNFCLEFFVFL